MRKGTKIVILSGSFFLLMIIGCSGNAPDGARLFERERCIYCHTLKGHGADIGPDLTDVGRRRTEEWLRDQIRNPKLHSANPGMPAHEYLSKKEIDAIIKHLRS